MKTTRSIEDVKRGQTVLLDDRYTGKVWRVSNVAGLVLVEIVWVEHGKRRRGSFRPERLGLVSTPPLTK